MIDARLAVPAALAWATTAVVVGVPTVDGVVAVALWVAAAVVLAVAVRVRAVAMVALALVAAAACVTAVAIQEPTRHPPVIEYSLEADRVVSVEVVATEVVVPGARSWEARLVRVEGTIVDVPVVMFGGTPTERVDIGVTLTVSARLAVTEPGDDRALLLFPRGEPTPIRGAPAWVDWANGLRAGFGAATTTLPGHGGALLPGLAIGDTTRVPAELDAAMKTSSLSHLTAVSGANCAIVIGLVMLVGGVVGLPRAVRVVVSLVVLVAFVVLVTPEPSVLRAAVMAALALVLVAFGRPVRGLPVVSLAVIAILIADPWLARSYGFALSVLATAGLVVLAGPLAALLGRVMPRWLGLVIAVPLAAQLACQPVLVLLDASVSTYGVVANLLAAPAAPVATIVGLVACVVLAVVPWLGGVLCGIAWLPAAWIAAVAQFFAGLPAARLPWPGGVLGVVLVTLLLVLVTAGVLGGAHTRRWSALLLSVVVVGGSLVAAVTRVAELAGRPPHWQVALCDVGQGDAVLVRSGEAIALIDTGPDPAALQACLSDLGIARLDLLVLTHYDLDHVGGTSAVVGRVEHVLVGPSGGVDDERLVEQLVAGGALVDEVSRGQSGLLGELWWNVLWPPARGAPEAGNDASVVLGMSGVGPCLDGCLSGVYLGDLGERAQSRLLAAGGLSPVDVVKMAHHGSADQDGRLYERLAATVGLIGVGRENGYGHPTASAVAMLDAAGTSVYRTDEQGLVLLAPGSRPGSVVAWCQRAADGARR